MPAISQSQFTLAGGGISDIFQGFGSRFKAQGNRLEAGNYREAAKFADLEAKLQNATTTVETAQTQRQVYQGLGRVEAGVADAGFSSGGSAGDLLRSSAQQGALQSAMAHQTGQVAEIGFREQERSYKSMAEAADLAAGTQDFASATSFITGGLRLAGAMAL